MSTHRKQSSVVKHIAKIGVAAAVIGIPALATSVPASATNWDAVAQCESGGNWSTNTGNGFSGGLQFTPSTWRANGGSGSPQSASRSEQIRVAENVKASQGMGAWPNCGSKGGSSSSSSSSSSSYKSSHSSSYSSSKKYSSASSHSSSSSSKAKTSSTATVKTGHGDYTVAPGDTLSKIATEKGVKGGWAQLYKLNKDTLSNANTLFPGQKLETK
ncbi:transglycosylase family protein [Sciscionella sediminilitoris]|uniref:LysM peptidoglycan-binding domain-containing protein n=1 Tax=Sciscionella sediminilitoris TaxID=1445613 RepID=UPI0004DF41D6|nr:transglycosylase family protein [Sciscionella sp. SE31]